MTRRESWVFLCFGEGSKRAYILLGSGGVMAPDRANKNFKNGRGYGQMSKNGNFYYFTLLGCKGG